MKHILYILVIASVATTSIAFANEDISSFFKDNGNGVMIEKRYVGINNQTHGAQLEIHCIYETPSNCNLFMNKQQGKSNLIIFGENDEFQSSIVERNGEITIYTDYPNGAKKQLIIKADGVYLPDPTSKRITGECKLTINDDRSVTCER